MGKQRNKPFHDTRKMLDKQASDKGGHLMKCRDCKKLVWGYDEGERVWWCAKRGHCPDLDVERNCSEFSLKKPDIFTALSTLQAENEKLRAELEYEKEHANAYYEECGQWEAENPQLKEKLEALKQDRDAIEQDFRAFAKQWWEEDSGFPCRWCKFERQGGCEWKVKHPGEICAGRAFEWRGQREDCPGCGEPLSQAPNEPLTLEQLREMDGEPAYIPENDCWVLVTQNPYGPLFTWPGGEQCSAYDWYEQVGAVYRRVPEGE